MVELRLNEPVVEVTIETLLRETAKKAAQEVNERSVKKFSNVPIQYQVVYLRKEVQELLDILVSNTSTWNSSSFMQNETVGLRLF